MPPKNAQHFSASLVQLEKTMLPPVCQNPRQQEPKQQNKQIKCKYHVAISKLQNKDVVNR